MVHVIMIDGSIYKCDEIKNWFDDFCDLYITEDVKREEKPPRFLSRIVKPKIIEEKKFTIIATVRRRKIDRVHYTSWDNDTKVYGKFTEKEIDESYKKYCEDLKLLDPLKEAEEMSDKILSIDTVDQTIEEQVKELKEYEVIEPYKTTK